MTERDGRDDSFRNHDFRRNQEARQASDDNDWSRRSARDDNRSFDPRRPGPAHPAGYRDGWSRESARDDNRHFDARHQPDYVATQHPDNWFRETARDDSHLAVDHEGSNQAFERDRFAGYRAQAAQGGARNPNERPPWDANDQDWRARFGSTNYGERAYGRSSYSTATSGRSLAGEYGGGVGKGSTYEGQPARQSFSGRGPKGYVRSDARIREDVSDRLSQDDDVDASEIEVSVQNGEVTLSGSVETRRMKHQAENLADSVQGVKDVHNQLRVVKPLLEELKDKVTGHENHEHHAGSGTKNAPYPNTSSVVRNSRA